MFEPAKQNAPLFLLRLQENQAMLAVMKRYAEEEKVAAEKRAVDVSANRRYRPNQ